MDALQGLCRIIISLGDTHIKEIMAYRTHDDLLVVQVSLATLACR